MIICENMIILHHNEVNVAVHYRGHFLLFLYRAYIAWEEQASVDPSEEHALRSNLEDYKKRLQVGPSVLPDPFSLDEGWLGESERVNWPSLYFCDIAEFLKMTTPKELYHRLCNEYKQGKAYRLVSLVAFIP